MNRELLKQAVIKKLRSKIWEKTPLPVKRKLTRAKVGLKQTFTPKGRERKARADKLRLFNRGLPTQVHLPPDMDFPMGAY